MMTKKIFISFAILAHTTTFYASAPKFAQQVGKKSPSLTKIISGTAALTTVTGTVAIYLKQAEFDTTQASKLFVADATATAYNIGKFLENKAEVIKKALSHDSNEPQV